MTRRPSGWREVGLGLGAYASYLLVRRRVWTAEGREHALRRARRIADAEHELGIGIEPALQRAAMRFPRLVDICNAGYAAGNVTLSVGWLIRLYHRDPARFRRERAAALLAFVASLPLFLRYPTAPPRALDGFVDTLAERGIALDHPVLVRFYNPIAAMPSQHVAFAVVSGIGLAGGSTLARRRWGWRSYPAGVALVVLATGNHFLADVGAGVGIGVLARIATR
jgi:hypothetical protein